MKERPILFNGDMVRALLDVQPLFGHPTGRKGLTHWYVFMKPNKEREL